MKRIITRILTLILAGSLLLSCAAAEESPFTQTMVERSLFSVGNTQRFHRAIEKARAGEEVSIVYLGGSITEGAQAQPQQSHCYAAMSAQMFVNKFMESRSQLKYHNAGISGTPSLLGITRVEKDVLAHQPDIVFVEFAVNDGGDPLSQIQYESLVAKLLSSETQPAVILIFTLGNTGYSGHVHMKQVGKHYDLGMISVYDAIWPEMLMKTMEWSDYSNDTVHPHTAGHAFIAKLIGHYYDVAAATPPTDYVLPGDARYGRDLEDLRNLRPGDPEILSEGGFPYGNATCYSYLYGWRRMGAEGGEPLTLQLNAKHLTIAFKQENNASCGTAEVWVDGKLAETLVGNSSSAWGNIVTKHIRLGEDGPHTVEIKMAEGHIAKKFTLLDLAVAGE